MVPLPRAQFEDLKLIREQWKKIIRDLGSSMRPALAEAVVEPVGEGTMSLGFTDETYYMLGGREQVLSALEDYVRVNYQKEIRFQPKLFSGGNAGNTRYVSEDELRSKIRMDIVTENS